MEQMVPFSDTFIPRPTPAETTAAVGACARQRQWQMAQEVQIWQRLADIVCSNVCAFTYLAPPKWIQHDRTYIFSYDDGMPPRINKLKNGQFQWKRIQTCFQCCHKCFFRQYVIKCQDRATSLAPKWAGSLISFGSFKLIYDFYDHPQTAEFSFLLTFHYLFSPHSFPVGFSPVAWDQVLASARASSDGRFDIASFNACLGAMAWPQAMAWLQQVELGGENMWKNDPEDCVTHYILHYTAIKVYIIILQYVLFIQILFGRNCLHHCLLPLIVQTYTHTS